MELAIFAACKVTGVSRSVVMSRNRSQSVVDCRRIIILIMHNEHYTDDSIADVIKRSRSCVSICRMRAYDIMKYSKSLTAMYEKAYKLFLDKKAERIAESEINQ